MKSIEKYLKAIPAFILTHTHCHTFKGADIYIQRDGKCFLRVLINTVGLVRTHLSVYRVFISPIRPCIYRNISIETNFDL